MAEKSKQREVVRMSEDAIRELAHKMYRNEVFLMWDNERDIEMVFMPLVLGVLTDRRKDFIESIGAVYAVYGEDTQVPGRAINGKPMFMACRLVNRKDCIPLWWEYERIKEVVERC